MRIILQLLCQLLKEENRMLEEIANIILAFTENLGHLGIYLYMTIVGTFIPLPSQVVLMPAGYLASKGDFNFILIWIVATLGSTSGATINYFLAKKLLRKVLKRKQEFIVKLTLFFRHHGKIALFLAPLTIGAGQYISIPAGIAKTKLSTFLAITFFANSIFNFFMILIGYAFNPEEAHKKIIYVTIGLLTFVVVVATIYIFRELKKEKNRS